MAGHDADRVRRGPEEGAGRCSWARCRGTARIARGTRSSARPGASSTGRSRRRRSSADDLYVTNVVKHFKFEERGKRRIHQTPRKGEIDACSPWLDTEIKLVRPVGLVALGATAAKALFGAQFRLTQHRGELIESELAPVAAATIHPAAIVRQRDAEARERERAAFTDDLRAVYAQVAQSS